MMREIAIRINNWQKMRYESQHSNIADVQDTPWDKSVAVDMLRFKKANYRCYAEIE